MTGKTLYGFDWTEALDRVGGDEELLRELIALFLEDYSSSMSALQAAVSDGDAHGTERAAHHLKGAIANFGAEAATQAALALEVMGRQGRTDAAAYDRLTTELTEVCSAFRERLSSPVH